EHFTAGRGEKQVSRVKLSTNALPVLAWEFRTIRASRRAARSPAEDPASPARPFSAKLRAGYQVVAYNPPVAQRWVQVAGAAWQRLANPKAITLTWIDFYR